MFDTNVVISALVFGRRLGWLRQAWADMSIIPIVCRETAAELLRVLEYPKFRLTSDDREMLLRDYLPVAEVVSLPHPPPPAPLQCRDRDDVVFIQLAITADADFLVSGDSDLTSLRNMFEIKVISAEELRLIMEDQ